jgi:hypothetical protein
MRLGVLVLMGLGLALAVPQVGDAKRHAMPHLSISEARYQLNRADQGAAAAHPDLLSWRIYGCRRIARAVVNCAEDDRYAAGTNGFSVSNTCSARWTIVVDRAGTVRFHAGTSSCRADQSVPAPTAPTVTTPAATIPAATTPAPVAPLPVVTTPTPPPPFACATELGVIRENDCPPADLANPPVDFCTTHECIASFANGHGTAVQCKDGMWSMSGGIQGACSYHGGESSNPPGPPPVY